MNQCDIVEKQNMKRNDRRQTKPADEDVSRASFQFKNNPFSVFSGILPGTKWCGTGDIAATYSDLGKWKFLLAFLLYLYRLCSTFIWWLGYNSELFAKTSRSKRKLRNRLATVANWMRDIENSEVKWMCENYEFVRDVTCSSKNQHGRSYTFKNEHFYKFADNASTFKCNRRNRTVYYWIVGCKLHICSVSYVPIVINYVSIRPIESTAYYYYCYINDIIPRYGCFHVNHGLCSSIEFWWWKFEILQCALQLCSNAKEKRKLSKLCSPWFNRIYFNEKQNVLIFRCVFISNDVSKLRSLTTNSLIKLFLFLLLPLLLLLTTTAWTIYKMKELHAKRKMAIHLFIFFLSFNSIRCAAALVLLFLFYFHCHFDLFPLCPRQQ